VTLALTAAQRHRLLSVARASIESFVCGGAGAKDDGAGLDVQAGCFVSLHARGDLRGCIGTFQRQRPLADVVREMAVAAATQDPRFLPVSPEEVPGLTIEISVLGPRRRIRDVSEIEVGRHGLWLENDGRRGVLLPQVAAEQGWDAETFLEQTCRKAGLPPGAWRDAATIVEVFEADVFGEDG
jgi:AmmeMemoRadiSam system protein A